MVEDEQDPADALQKLLAERERAKRSVYAANIAREKAEEEAAHKEKLLQMQIGEGQKLAADMAQAAEEMVKAKEVNDRFLILLGKAEERAVRAEHREKILETILNRIEDELHDAILEEDDFVPLEDLEKPAGPASLPYFGAGEPPPPPEKHDPETDAFDSEDEEREVQALRETIREVKGSKLVNGLTSARSAVVNGMAKLSCRARLYVVAAASAPSLLMLAAMALASQGIYIDALRPLWTDAISDYGKVIVGAFVPVVLFGLWYVTCVRRRIDSTENVPATEQKQEADTKTEDEYLPGLEKPDEYLAALREIFGEEDDDDERESPGN